MNHQKVYKFIDLFAGIGGIRLAFESVGYSCIFSSEIDIYARKTYAANFSETPYGDITQIATEAIPDHDVLCAGFPCQPFSLAGVSKKLSLGHDHGFRDKTQGTLFFNVADILEKKRPCAFFLENVKNLLSHDKGNTFRVIEETLMELDYIYFYSIIDAKYYVPQHRERIYIVGFDRKRFHKDFFFHFPARHASLPKVSSILETEVEEKYILTDHQWQWQRNHAEKHKLKGNGFGYGLVYPDSQTRTLSARYYKDGAEILVARENANPRRLTPRECARLMGFPDTFQITVSNTQAYRQFGNSVVVPLIYDIAQSMKETLDTLYAGNR